MNNEVKKLWVDALRSGEYTQTTETLADTTGHCCLGVLCEVAIKNGVPVPKEEWYSAEGDPEFYAYDGATTTLPTAVKKWANLPWGNPLVFDRSASLAELNDNGVSFDTIADIIEQEL